MAPPEIPETMQAIQVVEYNRPYRINTVPVPAALGPHDLLVKVAVASHCHTDSMVQAGLFSTKLPATASHEGAGTVVAAGSAVAPADFAFGDRVMCGIPLHACGACAECTAATAGPSSSSSSSRQQQQYCRGFEGNCGVYGADGFFAEYARVDARWTTRLPDAVPLLSAAPLACAGRTVWRGVVQAGLARGQTLAIVGAGGGLGHMGVQFARGLGLRVVAVDARDEGLALAREVGADVVVDARGGRDATVAAVQAATATATATGGGGAGADATLVLSDVREAAGLACAVTKPHGTVVQIAQPDEIVIPFREIVFRDIRLRGSLLCSPEESEDMVSFIAEHGLVVKTHPFQGLGKIGDLMELVHSGKAKGKAAIIVDPEQLEQEKKLGTKA